MSTLEADERLIYNMIYIEIDFAWNIMSERHVEFIAWFS